MQQIFFIAPKGYPQVKASEVSGTHGWCAEGDDPKTGQVIGVVEMTRNTNPETVIDKLENQGIMWLPNHQYGRTISLEHAVALAKHGVVPTDTTASAMAKVFAVSGFNPHKPSRF